jgi:hypothetical protein
MTPMTTTTFSAAASRRFEAIHGFGPEDVAGLRYLLQARSNKALIGLYDAEAANMDTESGRWNLVCEDHALIVGTDNLGRARYQQSDPESWCEGCQDGEPLAAIEVPKEVPKEVAPKPKATKRTTPKATAPKATAKPKAKRAPKAKATRLSSMTPAEIDAELFPLWADRWFAADRLVSSRNVIAKAIWPTEYKETYEKYASPYSSKTTFAIDITKSWEIRSFEAFVERYRSAEEDLAKAQEAIAPYDAEYRLRPWTRYVLVGAGHLHYQHCHTLRDTTQRYLLAESSGLTADEVVAKYSYVACSKCFKGAPV